MRVWSALPTRPWTDVAFFNRSSPFTSSPSEDSSNAGASNFLFEFHNFQIFDPKKEKHLGNFTTWIKKYLQGFFESHFSHFWFFFIFCTLAVSLRTPWTGYDLHSWYEQPPHGVFTRYCSPTTRQCWDSDQCQQHYKLQKAFKCIRHCKAIRYSFKHRIVITCTYIA